MANLTNANTTHSAYDRAADADGAMKFTITVVMVYGGAVFGVLILGFFRGLSKNHDEEDKQVNYFLRDIDRTRRRFAKERDLNAMYQRLENIDIEWKSQNHRDTGNALGRGLANMMVLPVMLSRERNGNVDRKTRWPSLKRLRNLPRVFSRQKSSLQSNECVNTELQGIQIEDGSLVDADEYSDNNSPGINMEIRTISENLDDSDCGSFQSSFSYLAS